MRWFGAAFIALQHVHAAAIPERLKFIPFKIGLRAFRLNQFCFQHAYALSQRRNRLIGVHELPAKVDQLAKDIVDCGVSDVVVANFRQRLQALADEIKALQARKQFCYQRLSSIGGVATPMVAGWPRGVESRGRLAGDA